MTAKLWFTKDGADITKGIELRNRKANPFGWSTAEVWLVRKILGIGWSEQKIGDLYCGEPINMAPRFGFRVEHDPEDHDQSVYSRAAS